MNVLKALITLSKYLGCYEQFKARVKNHGIKWENQNSLQSFLRIMNSENNVMQWFKATLKTLDRDYVTFMKFCLISGLRQNEALNSFNLIIKLSKEQKLKEYYNSGLQSLEHFRYEHVFIRKTKNAFISFIPEKTIREIAECKPISYSTLRKRLKKHGLNIRINELRHYQATFMLQHGLLKEEVDLLHGRIGSTVFMKHYFTPEIAELRNRTLKAIEKLKKQLISTE